MQEYRIKIGEREYTLNNNNGKYDRVFDQKFNPEVKKVSNLTSEQILAYYDKLLGLIRDENRQKVENGQFWKAYEEKLAKQRQQEKSWDKKKKMAGSFVECVRGVKEVLWFIVLIVFLVALFFGYDKIIPVIKEIKELL